MNDEIEQEVKVLFEAAMKLEPRKRTAFIEVACSDDEPLRQKLNSLITSHISQSQPDPDHPATAVAEEAHPMGTQELSPERLTRLKKL